MAVGANGANVLGSEYSIIFIKIVPWGFGNYFAVNFYYTLAPICNLV